MLCHSNRGFIVGSAVSWYQYYTTISICLDKSSGTQYRICTQYISSVVGSIKVMFCSIIVEQTWGLIIYRYSYFFFPSEAVLAKKIKKPEAIIYAATVAGKNGTPQMTYAILPAARLRSAPSKARRQNGIVIRGGYHFAAARLGVQ